MSVIASEAKQPPLIIFFLICLFFIFPHFGLTKPKMDLPILGTMPEFQEIEAWLNSQPLTRESLKGKIVLVDFWTYSCINCIRTIPYLKDFYQKYKDQGFVIIGLHSPEFDFEKNRSNVEEAIVQFQIPYPIALDNKTATWDAYNNSYWPAHYFFDAKGNLRFHQAGEGGYQEAEEVIQTLIAERDQKEKIEGSKPVKIETNFSQIHSPETYLGLWRKQRQVPWGNQLKLNEWSLEGNWEYKDQYSVLMNAKGKLKFQFKAKKVNLVLAPSEMDAGMVVIYLDGKKVIAENAGKDVKDSQVLIDNAKLYELINLKDYKGEEHIITIEFLSPGIMAYAFTFG